MNDCKLVIPGTFIACGEGGNFCSEKCYEKSRNKKLGCFTMKVGDIITKVKDDDLITSWFTTPGSGEFMPLQRMKISLPALIIGTINEKNSIGYWRVLDADGVVGHILKQNV